jgi:hypothetical protein
MVPLNFTSLSATNSHARFFSRDYLTRRLSISTLFLLSSSLIVIPFLPGFYKLLALGLVILGVIMLAMGYRPYQRQHLNSFRLQGFAAANNFVFKAISTDTDSDDTGFIFTYQPRSGTHFKNDAGIVEGVYRDRPFKIGRHTYVVTAGANGSIGIEVYFLRLRLDEPLPQIVLRGGARARAIKRLRLNEVQSQGELFSRFKISCIAGAEDKVKDVLTSDLQHELLTIQEPVDVEINGKYMYLYFKRTLPMTQDILEHFFKIMTIVRDSK